MPKLNNNISVNKNVFEAISQKAWEAIHTLTQRDALIVSRDIQAIRCLADLLDISTQPEFNSTLEDLMSD